VNSRAVVDVRRRTRGRSLVVTVVLTGLAAAGFGLALSVGSVHIPLSDVARSLAGQGERSDDFIIGTLRLPRALTGLLVGGALGMSGAIFQTLVRNPLASPDIIGVTAGASAAGVIGVVVLGLGDAAVPGLAFAGALLAALVVYALSWRQGMSGSRLVLIGIAAGAMLTSVTTYVLTRSTIFDAADALAWLTGSLNDRTWSTAVPLMCSTAVLVPLALALARPLRALQLGDDSARGLGVAIEPVRLALAAVGVGLAAVATAAAGPVAFVAFVAAPVARRLVGAGAVALVPAALVGMCLVTSADLLGQHAFGLALPVGVVTSLVGAPFLVHLLVRSNRVGRCG